MGYIHGEAIAPSASVCLTMGGAKTAGPMSMPCRSTCATSRPTPGADLQARVRPRALGRAASPVCRSIRLPLAHLFHESGASTVGYEIDSTNVHARCASPSSAARHASMAAPGSTTPRATWRRLQLLHAEPVVPRGAGAWFHSKYAITDGVSIVGTGNCTISITWAARPRSIGTEPDQPVPAPGPGTHSDSALTVRPRHRGLPRRLSAGCPTAASRTRRSGILLSYGHGL